jgi:hypothetical protein
MPAPPSRTSIAGLVLAVLAVLLALAGCSDFDDERGRGDAPVEDRRGDDAPANVINMPDRFSNVAFKCWGPNGIYVTTRDAAPVVVPDDAQCEGTDAPR